MIRLTKKQPDDTITSNASREELLGRLYFYENLHYTLTAQYEMAGMQLRELERAGRINTPQYKELMGQQLISGKMLAAFNG